VLLQDLGVQANSCQIQRLFEISYSSAWLLQKKIHMLIADQAPYLADTICSSYFSHLFNRRSRETPARQHPSAEQMTGDADSGCIESPPEDSSDTCAFANSDNCRENESSSKNLDANSVSWEQSAVVAQLEPRQRQVLDCLSSQPSHFDELLGASGIGIGEFSSVLISLELEGLIDRMPGDWFIRGQSQENSPSFLSERLDSLTESQRTVVLNIERFVKTCFRGISRKYLQLYVAAWWSGADRRSWPRNALFHLCSDSLPCHPERLRSFVSAPLIKVMTS
jgi:hypothetical protein